MYYIQTRNYYPIVASLAGGALATLVIVYYNFYASGEISFSTYGQEKFTSIGGNFFDVIVSYERGLVTYYPVFALTVILSIWKLRDAYTFTLLLLILAYSFLYGSWHSWFLGAGMGHRGFIDFAPLSIIVLGRSMMRLDPDARIISYLIVACCIYITTSIMLAYWHGTFPFAGATFEQYYSALGLK
jgi:hypothetical protein